jgi:hypothetical protein
MVACSVYLYIATLGANIRICREVGATQQQDQPPEDASAVVPEVALLHDKPIGPKTEQRHPCQTFLAAIRQPGLRTPRHGSLITVDNRHAKLALRRFLLREHAGQIARLRIAERMLLPESAFGIKRADSGYVMLGPAALPHLCPPLGCLSRIHTPTLDKGTDNPPGRQDDEQVWYR